MRPCSTQPWLSRKELHRAISTDSGPGSGVCVEAGIRAHNAQAVRRLLSVAPPRQEVYVSECAQEDRLCLRPVRNTLG